MQIDHISGIQHSTAAAAAAAAAAITSASTSSGGGGGSGVPLIQNDPPEVHPIVAALDATRRLCTVLPDLKPSAVDNVHLFPDPTFDHNGRAFQRRDIVQAEA
eukprot:COSAG06_NODE_2167_length_7426_cov_7.331787_3_plen_103_part_00